MGLLYQKWTSGSMVLGKVESTRREDTSFNLYRQFLHKERAGVGCRQGQRVIDYFVSGCKPKQKWRIGTEHEKFGFEFETLRPIKYKQIAALLNGIAARFDCDKIMEGYNIIGLKKAKTVAEEMGIGILGLGFQPKWRVLDDIPRVPKDGLDRRCLNESVFLYPLKEVVRTGLTPADKLLDMYNNNRGNNIDPVFRERCYLAELDS